MPVINPVTVEQAAADVKPLFEQLGRRYGRVPTFFAMLAHRPNALRHFRALYAAVVAEGAVDPRLKELAYLKTSLVNGCRY